MVTCSLTNKLDECRRILFLVTLVLGIISLIGSEMPWVHITQPSDTVHTWNFITNSDNTNTTTTVSQSCNFTMEIFLSLYSAEICQKFLSGYLPGTYQLSIHLY